MQQVAATAGVVSDHMEVRVMELFSLPKKYRPSFGHIASSEILIQLQNRVLKKATRFIGELETVYVCLSVCKLVFSLDSIKI